MQTLLNKIKNHIEHWKQVNKYDCDFDYHGLENIINSHLEVKEINDMSHKLIDGKVVIDWTTGDPEGDRITLLSAYRDFVKELHEELDKSVNGPLTPIQKIFDRWKVDTENQIDDVPRIWIKRPE